MLDLIDFFKKAKEKDSSDIYIIAGKAITLKVRGKLEGADDTKLSPEACEEIIRSIFDLACREIKILLKNGDDDFSFALPGVARFRVSAYKQRGSLAAVIRVVKFNLPNPADIGITEEVLDLSRYTRGLVLVTGTAGSGKSTTLACIIDKINEERTSHIITLEDPLEYLHCHKKSIVSQREISSDTSSYIKALRAALRQSPDVILLGEMRDYETINIAMTAAETGHLVLSSLHTIGSSSTIDRIIDAFPPNQQQQIRVQLSNVLQAVVSQQLIPTLKGDFIPAFEIMHANSAIRNMIRENKTHQIDTVIQSSAGQGMISMDGCLFNMYKAKKITGADAVKFSINMEQLAKRINI